MSDRPRTQRWRVALACLLLGAVSCGDQATSGPSASASTPDERVDIVVFAASSLTEAFTELGAAFETAHPSGTVTFSFGGSSELVAQVNNGAPADIVATADRTTMAKLDTPVGDATTTFARNRMEIAVEPGNPQHIATLADLGRGDLSVVLCDTAVPCGAAAAAVLAAAQVTVTPKSLENRVKGVVAKIAAGEADAGIVFATDIAAAGATVTGVPIPDAVNVTTEYPIAVLSDVDTPERRRAQAFVEFLLSPAGQDVLAAHGFLGR